MKTQDRVVMVTGATGVIGHAIAEQMARRFFHVVLTGRDKGRTEDMVHQLIHKTGNQHIRGVHVDLSRRTSIERLAEAWRGPLHVLINNAAVTPRRREETPEGLEMQWATNVMAYVWMMEAFHPVLKNATDSRVVLVASYWAGGLDLNDLQFSRRPYDNDSAYRQSKQANRMLATAYGEKWREDGPTVNSCHPGDVPSRLASNLGFGGFQTPEEAADTPVWLATSQDVYGQTASYYERRQRTQCRFSQDPTLLEALYQCCHACC